MKRRWLLLFVVAMALTAVGSSVQGEGGMPPSRPEWVWDARIYFWDVIPQTVEEADALLRWLEKYGYNVVLAVPDLGGPLTVSAEDPRLYRRPVWEWEWQGNPEQNRVFKYFAERAQQKGIKLMTHQMVWSINAVDYHYEGIPINPEWRAMAQQTRDGRPVFGEPYRVEQRDDPNHAAHLWLCPLDSQVQAALRDVVPAMMADLGIEVFMGDWNFNGFQCDNDYFRLAYEADTGQRWPSTGNVGTPDFGGYRNWTQGALLVRALEDMRKGIKAGNPDAIIFGYSATPTGGEFETLPLFVDLLGDEVSVRSSFYDWPWQMAMLKYNFAVSQHYDVPVVEFYSTDSYSENFFAWALTHTAGLKMWRLLPWFSQWEAQHAELLNRPRPVRKDVALLYSRQTYVRYSDSWGVYWTGQADDGRPHHAYDFGDYDERQEGGYGWAGWARVLQDRHQPYDVILDGGVTPEGLSPYRVLILANAAALSDRQIEAIREFVRSGGTLISDYQTSLFDEKAQQRRDFGLADVLGVRYKGLLPPPGPWVSGPSGPSYFDDVLAETSEQPVEAQWVVEVGADPSARVLASYPPPDGAIPALVLNRYGEGSSLYFSGYPGSKTFFRRQPVGRPDKQQGFTYSDFTDPFYRALLNATLARAVPQPFLQTTAPPEIIVNALWCGEPAQDRLCIHLVNALGSRPENGTLIPPAEVRDPLLGLGFPNEESVVDQGVYEGSYEVPFPEVPGSVTVKVRGLGLLRGYVVSPDLVGTQPVKLTQEGAYSVVEVPFRDRYAIVVLDWAPPVSPQPTPPQPNFESFRASPLPASAAETGAPTPVPSPLAAVATEIPMPVPTSASVRGRSQLPEDDSYSALTLPGWVVGAGAALAAVLLIMSVAVWRSSTR